MMRGAPLIPWYHGMRGALIPWYHGMISFCKPVDFARYGQAGMNKI